MANTTNQRQYKKDNAQVVYSVQEYMGEKLEPINKSIENINMIIGRFEKNTYDWRDDIDAKINALLAMKQDIEKLKIDNLALMAFKDEMTTHIKYVKWTYKIMAFLAGAFIAFIGFSEKIKILFFK